jgi:hypothetical protein
VGSEGTLGVVTEITLQLIPKPIAQTTALAAFAKLPEACEAVGKILASGITPLVTEIMDHDVMRAIADLLQSRGQPPAFSLEADALEQLGYQAESGPWRSVYLQGAYELRNGVPTTGGVNTASPDTIKARMSTTRPPLYIRTHKKTRMAISVRILRTCRVRVESSARHKVMLMCASCFCARAAAKKLIQMRR